MHNVQRMIAFSSQQNRQAGSTAFRHAEHVEMDSRERAQRRGRCQCVQTKRTELTDLVKKNKKGVTITDVKLQGNETIHCPACGVTCREEVKGVWQAVMGILPVGGVERVVFCAGDAGQLQERSLLDVQLTEEIAGVAPDTDGILATGIGDFEEDTLGVIGERCSEVGRSAHQSHFDLDCVRLQQEDELVIEIWKTPMCVNCI